MTISFHHRRIWIGPLVTLMTLAGLAWVNRHGFALAPPPIYTLAVVFAAYVGGMTAGLVSATITIVYSAVFFSNPEHLFHYSPDNLARMLTFVIATPATALLASLLKQQAMRALAAERESRELAESANRKSLTLCAAIDQVDLGMVLLNREFRAEFINQASRRIWQLPSDMAKSKPSFVSLARLEADAKAGDKSDAYVAARLAQVQAGDSTPLDLRLSDGDIIRFQCAVLPEGGRMLSYTNVTDLVHHAEQLGKIAATDGMTGLSNRQHFLTLAEVEWTRFQQHERLLSLLMIDIDVFKSINDRFGHAVGDQAIIHVANICCRDNGSSAIIARLGGEEFALLLPETNLEQARQVAEQMRRRVAESHLVTDKGGIEITISVGVAQAHSGMTGIDELIKRADDALYAAKRGGRNRVAQAQTEMAPGIAPLSAGDAHIALRV